MVERNSYGGSRQELGREVQWALIRAPRNPDQLPKFIGTFVGVLIDKNSMAIAALSAEEEKDFSF